METTLLPNLSAPVERTVLEKSATSAEVAALSGGGLLPSESLPLLKSPIRKCVIINGERYCKV